jgi:hypothetical protein
MEVTTTAGTGAAMVLNRAMAILLKDIARVTAASVAAAIVEDKVAVVVGVKVEETLTVVVD